MVADWMRVGFVHGVMNTDNMSILGLTIDYGPYGWLEGFDPRLDAQHDRRRGPALPLRQPAADRALEPGAARRGAVPADRATRRRWRRDSRRFAETFESDVEPDDGGQARARRARPRRRRPAARRPLRVAAAGRDRHDALLQRLADVPVGIGEWRVESDDALVEPLGARSTPRTLRADHLAGSRRWLRRHAARVRQDDLPPAERLRRMNRANPKYVLRNYLAQLAIDALAAGDASVMERLMTVLRAPLRRAAGPGRARRPAPRMGAPPAGCSALSCSS